MTFGPDESAGARITSLDEYKKHLDYLRSQGYDELDTARVYIGGAQEAFTREAGWKEKGFKIATKWYPNETEGHQPEVITAKCELSLKELGTDSVDIYYLHARWFLPTFLVHLVAVCSELWSSPALTSRPQQAIRASSRSYRQAVPCRQIQDFRYFQLYRRRSKPALSVTSDDVADFKSS
jgi:diketogulonate reductase-like aldo/keto reductase